MREEGAGTLTSGSDSVIAGLTEAAAGEEEEEQETGPEAGELEVMEGEKKILLMKEIHQQVMAERGKVGFG